jgi:NAD(P)-dependent dehydrogenase (short-subunit alcohol dehydrogenase family)
MNKRKLLVVGARTNSLGAHCVEEAKRKDRYEDIVTAGITNEDISFDVLHGDMPPGYLDVIMTVGTNEPSVPASDFFLPSVQWQMDANFIGPMRCLDQWFRWWITNDPDFLGELNFVVISSNSAHIARSNSVGYCASKAALSMGIRSFARSIREYDTFNVWAYEPGWIDGTPMSSEVRERFVGPAHRMLRDDGLYPAELARMIVGDVLDRGSMLHGSCVRVDAGEQ